MIGSTRRIRGRASAHRFGLMAAMAVVSWTLGCAGSGGPRSAAVVDVTEEGLRITESSALGLGTRSEFREATLLLEGDDSARAIERLEAVVEAEPELTAPRVNLAIALREAGRYEEAEATLLRAAELNPRHPVVQNELGIVHRRQGRFEEARARYERALEIYGDFHFAQKNLGIVCELFLRDLDCAVESYRAYLDSVPGDEQVVMWVALLEQQMPAEVGK
jgi:Flp pilus assembly protein TadD